jgi:hypothetical protein
MKKLTMPLAILAAVAALTACGGQPSADAVTSDDVPDLTDLTQADADGSAAAAQVGDPATLLAAAEKEGEQVRGDVGGVLKFIKEATSRAPDAHGENVQGQQFARWDITDPSTGNKVHIIAIRTAPDRVRLVIQGENGDGLSLPLLTGVFVKKAPHVGGGRFHLSFDNISSLFSPAGTGHTGSLHFLFANARPDLHGRRVLYVNVDDIANPSGPKNFAADLVRLVGVGGRFRSIYAADFVPQVPGDEALGMRVAWKDGLGGRADVVIASLAQQKVLAVAHECWDNGGLRTAYKQVPQSADDPDAGDVSNCSDLADATIDQAAVQQNGAQDSDPDLDNALDSDGANSVSDADASDDSVPDVSP